MIILHTLFTSLLKIICCVFLCSCKPRIGGRQCDRCAAGYYRFPDCIPCNCNQGGVTADVCHPDTGRCLCKVSSFHQLAYLKTPSYSSLFICLPLLWLSLYYCCHICREMLLASSAIPVGKVPSILTPPTLMAVPAASASERLTSVRAPVNAGGRCVCFSCPCMPMNAFGNFMPAKLSGWCGEQRHLFNKSWTCCSEKRPDLGTFYDSQSPLQVKLMYL